MIAASAPEVRPVFQTLSKNWWLLAVCAVLEATYAGVDLFMRDPSGSVSLRNHALRSTLVLLGRLAVAAGVCTVVAALWKHARAESWLLFLNGVALGLFGLILSGLFGTRIRLVTVAFLLAVMALSIGVYELLIARKLRRLQRVAIEWFFGVAGAISVAFALTFLALSLRVIELQPEAHWDFVLFGTYFALSAICMLALAATGRSGGVQASGTPTAG